MTEEEAHRHFSVDCFNKTWELLEKPTRTPEENRLLAEMAHASLFHWLAREDVTPVNESIGLWQISRVSAVLGHSNEALRYAQDCIAVSEMNALPHFYLAYGFEAAARACGVAGDHPGCRDHLESARKLLPEIEKAEDRELLEADLDELEATLAAKEGGD